MPGRKLLNAMLCSLLAATGADAGINEGFTVSLGGPRRIENPQVGQTVSVPVVLSGTVEVKGVLARLGFDPALLSFTGYDLGDITPEAQDLVSPVRVVGDGLAVVDGGSALFGVGRTVETTGGLLGTFHFEVIAEVPDDGTTVAVLLVEVNSSGEDEDRDVVELPPGQLNVLLIPVFPNAIHNVVVEREPDGALVRWSTRFQGFEDILRVRPRGSADEFTILANPLSRRFDDNVVLVLRRLRQRNVDLETTSNDELIAIVKEELGLPALTPNSQIRPILFSVRELDAILRTRNHLIPVRGLQAETAYEFLLISTALDGRRSPVFRGHFSTRSRPDLRPLVLSQIDIQVRQTGAAVSMTASRACSVLVVSLTRVDDSETVFEDTVDIEGKTRLGVAIEDLSAGTEYELAATVVVTGRDRLIGFGLAEGDATRTFTRRFRTRAVARALRMLGPPAKLVGSDRANIVFAANQPVEAILAYGPVDGSGKALQDTGEDDDLYVWEQESTGTLNLHNITLSNLTSSTDIRYKITLVTPAGDTFTTDPRGNFQWSRDLMFRTAAAGDTLPPELILGPIVDIRDVLVVVRFFTDVPTAATIFVGTQETFDTDDEIEFPDLTTDGERRFSNEHSIIVAGLDPGESYRYRLEIESTNGKVTVYDPSAQGSGKPAGALQPPGGAGAFTTSNDPDTQFPVILSGPTVSSKTHETAIIEWTTDEPANSDVQFGVLSLTEDSESSGIVETSHKVTLSNLTAGTAYNYIVGSTDAAGNGATQSAAAVFTTDPEVDLTAPVITVAPAVVYKNDESATVRWTTDEDATAQVSFGTDAGSLDFIRTLSSTAKTHEIALTNLTPSTTYHYQVASEDLSNNGPTTSDVLSFTTDAAADVTLPVISSVSAEPADSSAIVVWQTDELADSFVDFGTVSGILDVTVGSATDVTSHQITLTNLTPDTEYFFTVGSIDRAGNGPVESAEMSFRTVATADVTPPAAPAGLTGTAGSQQVVLSWTANTELDLAGYNVYRSAGDDFTAIATRVSAPTYTDLTVTNDTQYSYRVTAIDRVTPPNESAVGATVAFTPSAAAAPSTPTNLAVGASLEPTFTFSNATPFSAGATLTYTIQVSTQPDFSNVTASQSGIAAGSGSTSWTITRTLTESATYYWRVRAVEGSLIGPFTDAASFVATAVQLLPGDFDDSGFVDLTDFFLFIDVFGQPAEDFPLYDLDGTGPGTFIGLDDFFAFVDLFGTSRGKLAGGAAWAFAHRLDETARLRLDAAGGPMGDGAGGLPRDVIRLRVAVDDAEALAAYGLMLTWDPNLMTLTGAAEGPGHLLKSQGGETGLFQLLDEHPGRLLLGNGLTAGEPVSGSGVLAELTFRLHERRRAAEVRFDLQQAFLASSGSDVRRALAVEAGRLRPAQFVLGAAYPNPFNPATHIDFALAVDTPARLAVYDVLGRRVRTLLLATEPLRAGYYSVTWDGRDGHGRTAGNGVYFYRLDTPAFQRTGKMMMLK